METVILRAEDWIILLGVILMFVFMGYIAVALIMDGLSSDARSIQRRIRRDITER